MRIAASLISVLCVQCLLGCGSPAKPSVQPGEVVNFPTSCGESARRLMPKAVTLLHNMAYDRSRAAFSEIARLDPDCAMAYWGMAMTDIHPIWPVPPTNEMFEQGKRWIEKAESMSSEVTDREKAYIDATARYFEGSDKQDRLARLSKGYAGLAERFPDDLNATAFHALTLLATADPKDKTYRIQKEAGAIARSVLERSPNHPGALHYLIHAYDVPALAPQALEVARRYSKVAPDNAHALHMPSHIFTRLGHWDDSIALNIRSAAAARKYQAGDTTPSNFLHPTDYLTYAYLQEAKDEKARQEVDIVNALKMPVQVSPATAYALAAEPARYHLERGDWKGASAIEVRHLEGYPWDKVPAWEAITYFARGLGAARSGDVRGARAAVSSLEKLEGEVEDPYWKEQVAIQRTSVEAWAAYESGEKRKGLALMRKAAGTAAETEKSPVTPGAVLPAQELFGDMLLASGRAEEALAQYTAVLERSPNRYRSLYGAGHAAERMGDEARAKEYYTRLLDLTKGSGSDREELAHARDFLGKHP